MKEDPSRKSPSLIILAAVALVSLSVLLLEITFTRILSVMLSYHYVYLVISMALLGLGGSGIFAYLTRPRLGTGKLGIIAGLLALSIPVIFIAIARLDLTNILLFSLLMLVPFILAGVIISIVFQEFASKSGRVYAADLCGAAAGALLAIPLMNQLGGMKAGFFIGVVAAVAGLLLAYRSLKKVWFPALSVLGAGAIFFAGLSVPGLSEISLQQNGLKELSTSIQQDAGGEVIDSRWSSFGRTDLVAFKPDPNIREIFTDATAGTAMYRFTGNVKSPGPAVDSLRTDFAGYFPLQYLGPNQKDSALIIGAGGGRDVLAALMAGVKDITAVEVNPDTVDIVKEYSDYNGGIYTSFPNVKVVVAEGRSYLRQQKDKYDLIMMSIPVTKTSRSPQGFALTESYLFTTDSIADYYDHLTSEGRLVVVTLIQRFTLFLGEPVLAVGVLLFSLLVGAGLGGLTSGRLSDNGLSRKISLAAVAVSLILVMYAVITPAIINQLLGTSLMARALISAAMLIPLGFVMGFPFPMGMRLMKQYQADSRVPWLWGINGTASVVGSVLAIVLAMKFGFAAAIVFGAVCYIIAWLSIPDGEKQSA